MTTIWHFILYSIIGSIISAFIWNYLIPNNINNTFTGTTYGIIKLVEKYMIQQFIISILSGFLIGGILSFVI